MRPERRRVTTIHLLEDEFVGYQVPDGSTRPPDLRRAREFRVVAVTVDSDRRLLDLTVQERVMVALGAGSKRWNPPRSGVQVGIDFLRDNGAPEWLLDELTELTDTPAHPGGPT